MYVIYYLLHNFTNIIYDVHINNIVAFICFWDISLWKAWQEAYDLGDMTQKHIYATIYYLSIGLLNLLVCITFSKSK